MLKTIRRDEQDLHEHLGLDVDRYLLAAALELDRVRSDLIPVSDDREAESFRGGLGGRACTNQQQSEKRGGYSHGSSISGGNRRKSRRLIAGRARRAQAISTRRRASTATRTGPSTGGKLRGHSIGNLACFAQWGPNAQPCENVGGAAFQPAICYCEPVRIGGSELKYASTCMPETSGPASARSPATGRML